VQTGLLRKAIREKLDKIGDLERINSRIVLGRAHARDLVALKNSLQMLPEVKQLLLSSPSMLHQQKGEQLDSLEDITQLISEGIVDEPPLSLKEGGFKEAKSWIANLEKKERERTGISNLKVGYNKVFGYYIEITKSQLKQVPEDYIRKQTLVNAERFVTPALKEYENFLLGAEEKRNALEYELFIEIRERVAKASNRLLKVAAQLAEIDVMSALAEVAVHLCLMIFV